MTFMDWLIGNEPLGSIELRPNDPHQQRFIEAAELQMSLEAHEVDIVEARAREAHARIMADREARAEEMNRRWAIAEAGQKVAQHRRRA